MTALYNHDAEKSVIGALLQDEGCLRYLEQLGEDDFDAEEHRCIYAAICNLHANKEKVDVQTASNELSRCGSLDSAGGSSYLIEACRWVPTTANTGAYVKIVLERSQRRKIYHSLRNGADKLANSMNDVDDVLYSVSEGLKGGRITGRKITFADAMNRTFDLFDRAMRGESGAMKYGIRSLDAMTGGIWPGQNIVIAGNTGTGKSSFAMEIAVNNILSGKRVLICSREMTVEQYTQRIWARMSEVDLRNICDGTVGDGDMELLMDSVNQIAQFHGEFLTDVYTVEELQAIVEADPPDLLIVDYLQLMGIKKRTDNETVRLGAISIAMKRIALDNNIPAISLSQLSRQDGRVAVMPQKKDLRGSGNIEQDADVIIFLHQPESSQDQYVRKEDEGLFSICRKSENQKRYIVVNIAKQRQGRLGAFQMIFEPSMMRFSMITRNTQKEGNEYGKI